MISKNDQRIYVDIRKNAIGQEYDYTTSCLLDYVYFKNYYKMIAIDLSNNKQLIQKLSNKLILLEIYNHFYNILRLIDVLLRFPFITNETMGDYYL